MRRVLPHLRTGFGIMEIVVLLAVASVIAILIAAVLGQSNQLERVRQTWTILENMRLASDNGSNGSFAQDVGRNPNQLSQLERPITTA